MTPLENQFFKACTAVVTDWDARPKHYSKKEPPSLALVRAVLIKAKGK
jgi:hypothetical protein